VAPKIRPAKELAYSQRMDSGAGRISDALYPEDVAQSRNFLHALCLRVSVSLVTSAKSVFCAETLRLDKARPMLASKAGTAGAVERAGAGVGSVRGIDKATKTGGVVDGWG
jgi:hypothetical protein